VARGTSTWRGGGGWIIGERRNGVAGEAGGLSAIGAASGWHGYGAAYPRLV